jgi:hypothetical protein
MDLLQKVLERAEKVKNTEPFKLGDAYHLFLKEKEDQRYKEYIKKLEKLMK